MKFTRRNLFALSMAGALTAISLPVLAGNVIDYDPSKLQTAVDSGKPYLLDFSASWCTTCTAQARVLDALQAENEAYDNIPILRVDWDTYRSGDLVSALAIPRRSTLVMMQGEIELGRIVAGTGRSQIAQLMDLGL